MLFILEFFLGDSFLLLPWFLRFSLHLGRAQLQANFGGAASTNNFRRMLFIAAAAVFTALPDASGTTREMVLDNFMLETGNQESLRQFEWTVLVAHPAANLKSRFDEISTCN